MQEIRPDNNDKKTIKNRKEEALLMAELNTEEEVVQEKKSRDKRTPEKKIRK
jgi:hypothetical protein